MDGDKTRADLQAELGEVERDLADVRRNADTIRDDVAGSDDPADRGALIQQADEQDQLAEQLTARREELRRRLAEA
jgi:F0F1-type ATP synthase membrane subunit b/b'